jgi:signal peptidase II
MSKKKSFIIVGIIIVVGLVVDLVTKAIFSNVLQHGMKDIDIIPNLLRFTYVENDGAAYGMLGGKTWLLIVVTMVFIVGFVCYYIFNHSTNLWYNFGIGLIISGAIGNLVDRIFFDGIVRDFISIRFFSFVFNFADMWITFGVICFGVSVILDMFKEIKEKKGKEKENDSKDK